LSEDQLPHFIGTRSEGQVILACPTKCLKSYEKHPGIFWYRWKRFVQDRRSRPRRSFRSTRV